LGLIVARFVARTLVFGPQFGRYVIGFNPDVVPHRGGDTPVSHKPLENRGHNPFGSPGAEATA